MRIRTTIAAIITGFFLLACASGVLADGRPIRVLVWDEQQPAQKKAYDGFLGESIAAYLKGKPGMVVTTARLDDPEQGISDKALDETDVLIWWGHVRNREVKLARGKEIAQRVADGKLSLIALHSAHWSSPFIEAMWMRSEADALAAVPEAQRATAELKLVYPKMYAVPKRDARLAPYVESATAADGHTVLSLNLPSCVFPAYRADGQPGHLTTLLPDHPIAAGIPKTFDVPQTEMYDEPFHVPAPDAVVFEEKWDKGEHFRSGCVWNVGKGNVFYFRPGHETYPVYKQEIPLKIIENAARWMGESAAGKPPSARSAMPMHGGTAVATSSKNRGVVGKAAMQSHIDNPQTSAALDTASVGETEATSVALKSARCQTGEQAAQSVPFFVGTYTGPKSKGIYVVQLNTADGSLGAPQLAGEVANPSFLWMHPSGKYLYAAGELDTFKGTKGGAVSAFAIDPDTKKLTLLNQQPAGGGGTCFVAVDGTGKVAMVANYGGGSVESLPIGEDGKLGEPVTFVQDAGNVADPKRQGGPHAHSIWCTPDNRYAIAADLGLDKLFIYKIDSAKGSLTPSDPPFVATEPRFGPRHFAFHPNGKFMYAIGEMALAIDAFAYDAEKGTLTKIGSVPTLDRAVKPSDSCAEIAVHPSGKFVYGSNRGEDDIAIFAVEPQTGKLTPTGRVKSGGKTPRNFAIDPSGEFLIAAHQTTNDIFVFRINPQDGSLTPTSGHAEVGSPVCIRFLTAGR